MKKIISPGHTIKPLLNEEDIQKNPDNKIDEDFPGYPHAPSRKETIQPKTRLEKITADAHHKDEEKRTTATRKIDEQQSDGSANAFDGTEKVTEDE